jgi:hypothetical protein
MAVYQDSELGMLLRAEVWQFIKSMTTTAQELTSNVG